MTVPRDTERANLEGYGMDHIKGEGGGGSVCNPPLGGPHAHPCYCVALSAAYPLPIRNFPLPHCVPDPDILPPHNQRYPCL